MAGAQKTLTASTIEDLEARVNEWYAQAAANGLEDVRMPWDPSLVLETDEGFAFNVWANS
jgi:hypothetical protein